MTVAHRIVVTEDGYIQQIGTPKDIYNAIKNIFGATFIRSPIMNLLEANYDNGTITVLNGFSFKINEKRVGIHDEFYKTIWN